MVAMYDATADMDVARHSTFSGRDVVSSVTTYRTYERAVLCALNQVGTSLFLKL